MVLLSLLPCKEVVSGDDDLPKRDDSVERRRKHDQLRVLPVTGSKTEVGIRADDRRYWN